MLRTTASLTVAVLVLAASACSHAPSLPVIKTGGDFSLTDHNGKPFELASLRGKAVLIFFG